MTLLQFATDASPGGALVADDSGRATACSFATNIHGFAELRSSVPMALAEAFQRFDRAGLPHQRISDGPGAVYEGRLEDVAINGDGVNATALGYSRALGDVPYNALWSTTDISSFRPLIASELAGATPDRFTFDTNNRVYITPVKGATFGVTGAPKQAFSMFQLPDDSTRDIIGVSFDYVQLAPAATWRFFLFTQTAAFATIAAPWGRVGGVGIENGSVFVTFAAARAISFFMDFNAADAVFAGETGSAYLIITNLRIVTSTTNKVDTTNTVAWVAGLNTTITVGSTARMYVGQRIHLGIPAALGETVVVKSITDATHFIADTTTAGGIGNNVQAHVVYADEIVRDLVSATNTANPTQLSSATTLIQSPALDLFDEVYTDQYPVDILTHLASLGDSQATPRQWEWAVWENRQLQFQPRGSTARTWYVDLASLDVERSLNALWNSEYATYQEAGGRTLRAAITSDAASIARYGLTRRTFVRVESTSATQAAVQQAAALADTKDPIPRARLTVGAVFDLTGARWPLTAVRANDIIVIRNLPPTLGTTVDRIRSFRIVRTEYNLMTDSLTIEPESPLPTLTALLARAAAPAWVTAPWWIRIRQ